MGIETYSIESATCIQESDKAIRVTGGDLGDDRVWIPKGQIDDDSEVWKEGQTGELIISEWIAEQKGFI